MKLKTIAYLELYLKLTRESKFEHIDTFSLSSQVIRVGRSDECEIKLPGSIDLLKAVSRKHFTLLFYGSESNDYYLIDGTVSDENKNISPVVIPSRLGVYVNGRRLIPGEKYPLKNGDEIHLIPERLKFVYHRPQIKATDKLKDTFIPDEFL